MRALRVGGIVLCIAVIAGAIGTMVADRADARSGPREDLVPGFHLSYRCVDARDEFRSSEVAYRLELDGDRWTAGVELSVDATALRSPCEITFGVPRGSTDTAARGENEDVRVLSLERDGSPDSGVAGVAVRPPDGDGQRGSKTYSLQVSLPEHFDLFHALGIGKHVFRFEYFGPGEAGSFRSGRITVDLPSGHSFVDASPEPERSRTATSRTWTLQADRDLAIVTTFQDDRLRRYVELAPEALFGGAAALLALMLPAWRRTAEELEPEAEPEPEPEPEPEVLRTEPESDARPPQQPPEPPPPADLRPLLPPPLPPSPRRKPAARRLAWLALLAVPVIGRLLKRRRRG